jgi:hypothetical protein
LNNLVVTKLGRRTFDESFKLQVAQLQKKAVVVDEP